MKQTGVVYLYNMGSSRGRQIKMLCLKQGLQIRTVERSQYLESVGGLAGVPGFELTGEEYTGDGFTDEMLLMKGFTNTMLDNFLRGFRTMKINPVALKAILTDGNCGWNSLELHDELVKERQSILQNEKQK